MTITDCAVTGNEADTSHGGAFSIDSGASLTLSSSTIVGNEADNNGGAIYAFDSPVILADTLVELNLAEEGGGAYLAGTASLTCTADPAGSFGFLGNEADPGAGGGVHLGASGGSLTSTHCDWGAASTIDDNSPVDVLLESSGNTYLYGLDETFACASGSCL